MSNRNLTPLLRGIYTIVFTALTVIYIYFHLQAILPVSFSLILYPVVNAYLVLSWFSSTPQYHYTPTKRDRLTAIVHIYLLFVFNISFTLGLLLNFSLSDYSVFFWISICLSIPLCAIIGRHTEGYRRHYKLKGNPLSVILLTSMLFFNILVLINIFPQNRLKDFKLIQITEKRLAYGFVPSIRIMYEVSGRQKKAELHISRAWYDRISPDSDVEALIYRGLLHIPWYQTHSCGGYSNYRSSNEDGWHSYPSYPSMPTDSAYTQ